MILIPLRDTVDSVGIIPKRIPFTKHNTALKTFRHAISLDEHRVKFIPFFCVDGKIKKEQQDRVHDIARLYNQSRAHATGVEDGHIGGDETTQNGTLTHRNKPKREVSERNVFESLVNKGQMSDVQEVWFSGVHCGSCLAIFLHLTIY